VSSVCPAVPVALCVRFVEASFRRLQAGKPLSNRNYLTGGFHCGESHAGGSGAKPVGRFTVGLSVEAVPWPPLGWHLHHQHRSQPDTQPTTCNFSHTHSVLQQSPIHGILLGKLPSGHLNLKFTSGWFGDHNILHQHSRTWGHVSWFGHIRRVEEKETPDQHHEHRPRRPFHVPRLG
jgi:hypothetical protein